MMCEAVLVLVRVLVLGDEETGINELLLLLRVRLLGWWWLILELEDVLHDLIDLLLEQLLGVF